MARMDLDCVLRDIRACRACAGELPHEPRPVVRGVVALPLCAVVAQGSEGG